MTEQQFKILCQWAVDNSNRPLTDAEREIIKQAIDNAKKLKIYLQSPLLQQQ